MGFAPWLEIRSDLTTALARLTKEEKSDPAIKHALLIRSAWALSNYHTFFQLYLSAPNMSGYLLDLFVQRERVQALKAMVKSWVVFVLYSLSPLMISLFVVYMCLEVVKWLNARDIQLLITLLRTWPSDFFGTALIECSFAIKTRIIIIARSNIDGRRPFLSFGGIKKIYGWVDRSVCR